MNKGYDVKSFNGGVEVSNFYKSISMIPKEVMDKISIWLDARTVPHVVGEALALPDYAHPVWKAYIGDDGKPMTVSQMEAMTPEQWKQNPSRETVEIDSPGEQHVSIMVYQSLDRHPSMVPVDKDVIQNVLGGTGEPAD